jgi:hypothetical protein
VALLFRDLSPRLWVGDDLMPFPVDEMNEDQDFRTVLRFLESLQVEVGGRMATIIDPELDHRLRALAQGQLNDMLQDRLLSEIAKNPAAVSRLAEYLTEQGDEPANAPRTRK